MSRKVLFLIAAAIVANGTVCLAQVEQGAIAGAVADATAASVPAPRSPPRTKLRAPWPPR